MDRCGFDLPPTTEQWIKYLQSEVYNDPSVKGLVDKIRENEVNDLYVLGAKGRSHEMLDEGNSQMIPTIALVDRTFQQRRLLEGRSTSNVSTITHLLEQNEAYLSSRNQNDNNKPGTSATTAEQPDTE